MALVALRTGQGSPHPQESLVKVALGFINPGEPGCIGGGGWPEGFVLPPGGLCSIQVSSSKPHLGLQAPADEKVGLLVAKLVSDRPRRGQIACGQVCLSLQSPRRVGDPEFVAAAHHLQGTARLAPGKAEARHVIIDRDQMAVARQKLLQTNVICFIVLPPDQVGDEGVAGLGWQR